MFAYVKPEQKKTLKDVVQKKEAGKAAPLANLTGIPDGIKSKFENFSGFSFDDVRVHYNSGKPAQLQALAYTQGNHVYIASGQEKHLGHELGHIVQQKEGRVKPRRKLQGVDINDDGALEADADIMGKSVQMMAENESGQPVKREIQTKNILQRMKWDDVEHDRIEITGSDNNYTATYDNTRCGDLNLYEDAFEIKWINNIEVNKHFQRKGIGLSLLNKAVQDHNIICAAWGMPKEAEEGEEDTRHLSEEGVALVRSAVRNGILMAQWCYNPKGLSPEAPREPDPSGGHPSITDYFPLEKKEREPL